MYCLHLEAYHPLSPEWQVKERKPGPGKRQSFPRRRGESEGKGRGCGRPVAGRRGALAWACSSVHPGGAGAGAAGEPAEGAVRPLRRPRGDTSPSCRRLGPPAGEGLPGSPTASSCLAYSPAASPPVRAGRQLPARSLARRPPPQSAPSLARTPRSPRPAPAMLSFQYPDVYRDETSVSTPLAPHRAAGPAPPAARLPQPRVPAPRTASRPLFAEPTGVAGLLPAPDRRAAAAHVP